MNLLKKNIKTNELFGNYIRNLRLKKQIGQRELARKIGVSASYLNDIEQNKRPSPRVEVLEALTDALEADIPTINDLAGLSKNDLPPDILEFIRGSSELVSLLRLIKAYNLTDQEIMEFENFMNTSKAKAIIIAADWVADLKAILRTYLNVC